MRYFHSVPTSGGTSPCAPGAQVRELSSITVTGSWMWMQFTLLGHTGKKRCCSISHVTVFNKIKDLTVLRTKFSYWKKRYWFLWGPFIRQPRCSTGRGHTAVMLRTAPPAVRQHQRNRGSS